MIKKLAAYYRQNPHSVKMMSGGFVLFIIGVGGAWFLLKNPLIAKGLRPEIFQFFLIVVLGGGISMIHQLFVHQREDLERKKAARREKEAHERQLLLNTYNEFLSAYDKAKRARRILRARVLRPESENVPVHDQVILAAHYDDQMETLIEAQLELESIELRMRGNAGLFGSLSELDGAATAVRMYLHGTVEEYQDRRTEFKGDPREAPLSELPALMAFMGSYGRVQDWNEFNEPFQIALRCLRLAIQRRSGTGTDVPGPEPSSAQAEVSTRGLGAGSAPLRLRAHDWQWSHRFREESERLRAALEDRFDSIEHVGSTAVHDLWAVPVIDMVAQVASLQDEEKEQLAADLSSLNYERCPGPEGVDLMFHHAIKIKDNLWTTHSLSVVQTNSSHYQGCTIVRDFLKGNAVARRQYDAKRRALAQKHDMEPETYHQEKTQLFMELCQELLPQPQGSNQEEPATAETS